MLDLRDSVARDHLANERTFLAWFRTGFATSALGIVIARLQMVNPTTISAGATFKILALAYVMIGVLCVCAGAWRYAYVGYNMENGQYPTGGLLVSLVALLGILAFFATFVLLLL